MVEGAEKALGSFLDRYRDEIIERIAEKVAAGKISHRPNSMRILDILTFVSDRIIAQGRQRFSVLVKTEPRGSLPGAQTCDP
jgi:hypothetical protein